MKVGNTRKTFIGSGVGTGSVQVLQGVEFEMEPQEDHTFEVEPHGNVDHIVGSHKVQTQNLIYYHPTRDREQHSSWELFNYREDSNEAAFAVVAVKKIYAHESLTFNNTVACEVISKWKDGLKDNMDARSYVYVLSNGCRKCSDNSDGYYWEYTPGMFIHLFLDIDGMVFSCRCKAEIWATNSLLDKAKGNVHDFVGGTLHTVVDLQTDVQVFVDFDYAMAGYMTLTEAAKEAIWLKGLAIESGFELKMVAGIATSALSKAIPGPRSFEDWEVSSLQFMQQYITEEGSLEKNTHKWKNPDSRNARRNCHRVTKDEPELFGPDELLRPPDKERIAKSQRSSNSTASSGSNPTMFQEMMQQEYELDWNEKMERINRETNARVVLYDSQKVAEDLKVLQMSTD
ncbi:hypothetical protein Tco_0600753 [Tanacetum coccineum]